MELFERVRAVAKSCFGSETKLAEFLGMKQQKLYSYFSLKSEKHLYQHLPAILAEKPDISRDWLYFGDGEMFLKDWKAGQEFVSPERLAELEAEVAQLTENLNEANATIGALVRQQLNASQLAKLTTPKVREEMEESEEKTVRELVTPYSPVVQEAVAGYKPSKR